MRLTTYTLLSLNAIGRRDFGERNPQCGREGTGLTPENDEAQTGCALTEPFDDRERKSLVFIIAPSPLNKKIRSRSS